MLAAQQAYVRKVIGSVNDLDNVVYEISDSPQARRSGNTISLTISRIMRPENQSSIRSA